MPSKRIKCSAICHFWSPANPLIQFDSHWKARTKEISFVLKKNLVVSSNNNNPSEATITITRIREEELTKKESLEKVNYINTRVDSNRLLLLLPKRKKPA